MTNFITTPLTLTPTYSTKTHLLRVSETLHLPLPFLKSERLNPEQQKITTGRDVLD